jgi:hypothetical protein
MFSAGEIDMFSFDCGYINTLSSKCLECIHVRRGFQNLVEILALRKFKEFQKK